MARTFIRQDAQIGSTLDTLIGFSDAVAPAATMESGAGTIADDLNNLRSIASLLKDGQAGNWYDDLVAPSTLEAGTKRGVDAVNDGLHAVEKKRVLADTFIHTDVTVTAAQNFEILLLAELPSNAIAAVGAVTTLGTVAAFHSGTFGQHSLDLVAGSDAVSPLNLGLVVDSATHDPLVSAGRQIWALFQTETVTDGHTMTGTTPVRAQLSFVRLNAAGTALEACPAGDIAGQTIHYWVRERKRLEDLTESDFLRGASIDIGAGSTTVDRQTSYTNQGTTPVDLTTNAILDLEGAGLAWSIRDDLEADLFKVTEGSAGGTSEVQLAAAVDVFNVDAIVNDFAAGATIRSGGTRPIAAGVTDGVIETTAGDLQLGGANGETILNDVNMDTEGTWTGPGVKVSETVTEVSDYETAFGGEVSLMNAIVQAKQGSSRTRVDSTMTANAAAAADVNGPGTAHANCDTDLLPYDTAGIASLEVFLNGELYRLTDDYTAGGTPAEGDLQFTFNLKGTGAKPDQLTVIRNGTN